MKKWISCLFIIILLVFILPVKQIGESLLKKNTTDQVDDTDANANETAKQQQQLQEEVWHQYILPTYAPGLDKMIARPSVTKRVLATCRLTPHFVPDITTPPPNCA